MSGRRGVGAASGSSLGAVPTRITTWGLPQRRPIRLWQRLLTQLRDPLIIVLQGAAVLTAVTGDWTDMAVIVLVIVVNTAVGGGQEVRADRAISALSQLTAPLAVVVRDWVQRQVPAAEVVVR
ncbi:cation-transporting P-type ATPase [Nocardia sp. CA-119907]|uniref:cation-transporting P-type ATPase n=1 Tax=Nocardia sp. CA-119907 TaxID=3239973 RepID=UPI003D960286